MPCIKLKKCKIHGPNCDRRCIDPNVDNGMMTKIWGPAGWMFLHCITFGYPYAINPNNPTHKYKKQHYKIFFESLGNVFPCKYCRESYLIFIKELPIDNYLDSRKNLCKWLYKIHNKVNEKLDVPKEKIPSFKEVQILYEQFRAKCKKSKKKISKKKEKGCVNPADGMPKKCFIKVIKCKEGDSIEEHNSLIIDDHKKISHNNKMDFFNYQNWIVPSLLLLIFYLFIFNKIKIEPVKINSNTLLIITAFILIYLLICYQINLQKK